MEAIVAEVPLEYIIGAVVLMIVLIVYSFVKNSIISAFLAGAVLIAFIIWAGVTYESARNNILDDVETTYGFNFAERGSQGFDFPLGTEPAHDSFLAYLDDVPGQSACLVEITEDSMYEITCNGEIREPRK
jgi:hypothetical protein